MKKKYTKIMKLKIDQLKSLNLIKGGENFGWVLPSFFLSHTSFSHLFEALSSLLCSRITYQQLELLQVVSNAFVGRRKCAFSVGAMPAKGKTNEEQKQRESGGTYTGHSHGYQPPGVMLKKREAHCISSCRVSSGRREEEKT